ncbi:30S ribosomal protein S1 [candidate division WWE3 bacterium CG10_big_fil_rev_8_21_14_0_10_32_10]|uniref:30S ribosomal protein S1 n=1 Tax=candidate division WWE3 bacterium CG10_big_fil_rev_8_21_14_0_10_32_10 TaxID=1975090 RepID=A0A2H0R9P4_UNCKA|nr:MAG: 30S ribosomal protein S1 [candidate division WWE3 bacterium CG10_big_fil_rev_8_21_14_0_10_32_10]
MESKVKTPKQAVKKAVKAQNMGDLITQYGIEVKKYPLGVLVEGTVVSANPNRILVDVGAKAEGIVKKEEMKDTENTYKTLKVGDSILVMVVKEENKSGFIELSLKKAETERRWRDFNKMYSNKIPFEVTALQYNKGGLICDAMGMQGFVPISHLDRVHFAEVSSAATGSEKDIAERMDPLIGKSLKVVIIELDREQNRIVLSEKQVDSEKNKERKKERLDEINVGDTIKGLVSGVVPFGLFVDLDGLEGLVHVSEIAWEKVENPLDYYNVGDEIKAQVLDIDTNKGKVGLSVKRLKTNPWESVAEKYPENTKIKGTVTRIVPFGAFVQLEPGLEGLVHVSEMNGDLKEGQKVEALVTLVDPAEQRLGLSIRQLEEPQVYR